MSALYPNQRIAFHLAASLTRLRERRGLSRADVADGCGLGRDDVYRYETANAVLRAADLPKLADILNVTPQALFDGLAEDLAVDEGRTPAAPDGRIAELVHAFIAIRSRTVRAKLLAVARKAAPAA